MNAKLGDVVECAIWITGTESEGMLRQWRADAAHMLARSRGLPVMKLSPLSFEIKRPGEDRVPQVPDHISGPDVRLLIATASVVGFEPAAAAASFAASLDKKDRARLRAVTRRAHARAGGAPMSDAECDAVIDQIGPVAAAETLRRGLDGRPVH